MEFEPTSDVIAEARAEGSALVIVPIGDITAANAPETRQEVLALLAKHSPSRVVFNLKHCEFCDSSGVAVLVEALSKLPAASRKQGVWVAEAAQRVRGMIEICRLTSILNLADSEGDALGA
ncbi:MAG: STAS domain-containing protein [Planctomycetota bacterium]